MSQPGIPSFRDKPVNRTVIVKVSLFTRAFSGTIIAADDTGFCLVSNEMNAALRQVTGGAIANRDAPSVYLPTCPSPNSSGSSPRSPTPPPPPHRVNPVDGSCIIAANHQNNSHTLSDFTKI